MPRLGNLLGLAGWLAICFVVAAIGAAASIEAQGFYAELIRPSWAPPAWLFGPVWSLLYALMAISAWLIWLTRASQPVSLALGLFIAQLLLNALWSWLFFSWRLGAASFIDILLLWLLIVATLILFWRIRPLAAALLVPYLLWVTFASALNLAIWQLNPTLLT